ncbi:winged helix-turn-helix transcriptional regulator [Chamaesiphon sp.]|uniref:winged helix-turn-helix transcriptional regulator n=1 Tax=Chamaesiphon sp. TaxID=2814140 RepID=UPI0035937DFF
MRIGRSKSTKTKPNQTHQSNRRKIDRISTKVLVERLQMLEEIGIVHRHYQPNIPPQVT